MSVTPARKLQALLIDLATAVGGGSSSKRRSHRRTSVEVLLDGSRLSMRGHTPAVLWIPSWHAVDLYTGLGLSVAAEVTCSNHSIISTAHA